MKKLFCLHNKATTFFCITLVMLSPALLGMKNSTTKSLTDELKACVTITKATIYKKLPTPPTNRHFAPSWTRSRTGKISSNSSSNNTSGTSSTYLRSRGSSDTLSSFWEEKPTSKTKSIPPLDLDKLHEKMRSKLLKLTPESSEAPLTKAIFNLKDAPFSAEASDIDQIILPQKCETPKSQHSHASICSLVRQLEIDAENNSTRSLEALQKENSTPATTCSFVKQLEDEASAEQNSSFFSTGENDEEPCEESSLVIDNFLDEALLLQLKISYTKSCDFMPKLDINSDNSPQISTENPSTPCSRFSENSSRSECESPRKARSYQHS